MKKEIVGMLLCGVLSCALFSSCEEPVPSVDEEGNGSEQTDEFVKIQDATLIAYTTGSHLSGREDYYCRFTKDSLFSLYKEDHNGQHKDMLKDIQYSVNQRKRKIYLYLPVEGTEGAYQVDSSDYSFRVTETDELVMDWCSDALFPMTYILDWYLYTGVCPNEHAFSLIGRWNETKTLDGVVYTTTYAFNEDYSMSRQQKYVLAGVEQEENLVGMWNENKYNANDEAYVFYYFTKNEETDELVETETFYLQKRTADYIVMTDATEATHIWIPGKRQMSATDIIGTFAIATFETDTYHNIRGIEWVTYQFGSDKTVSVVEEHYANAALTTEETKKGTYEYADGSLSVDLTDGTQQRYTVTNLSTSGVVLGLDGEEKEFTRLY